MALYAKSERQKIIDHIIEKNLYFELRGRVVWQEMEKLEICPGRSWQSMKQHFHTNIINSLHCLNISEGEQKRILDCYYNRYLQAPMKRKRAFSSSNTEAEKQHNTLKKSKLITSDVENEIEKSPEKIKACSRTTTQEHTSNNRNMEDTQISGNKEIDPNMYFMDEDIKNDLDSSLLGSYSNQEDRTIIIYIKENMNWADLEYFDDIYKNCHEQVLSKRSATYIKKRFLDVILPNLYKYKILDVDEIILFYDRAGIDIPPEFEQILSNLMENTSNFSEETKDSILNSSLDQDEYSMNSNNYNNSSGSIEENKNINSQKYAEDIKEENEKGTNLERKNSVNNHTDLDTTFNMLQDENISFNTSKESDVFSNSNQSGSSTSKTNHDDNMIENKKYPIYQTENSQESKKNIYQNENIEKIDVAVQANVANFNFMVQFMAGQFCLNINNEEHAFIPNSKNKYIIMNELNVEHNIMYDNIHVINKKTHNYLQRIETLNEILERKILNLKNENITNPIEMKLLPVNKIQPLICPCAWKRVNSVNKRKSRILHLPVKVQHLSNNKHLEKICKCCTRVQPPKGKKSKKRKKFQKSNLLKESNDNAAFFTENKTKDVEGNCSGDQLQKKVVMDNRDVKADELDIDFLSDHSSPIISMIGRNYFKIVDINTLISGEVKSFNTAECGENIADNNNISNINSEILPLNYSPPNSVNDDSASIKFDTSKIYDTAMLENTPELNYHLSGPLISSHIPYLNDADIDSPEFSMLPSLFVPQSEELNIDDEMETKNMSSLLVQSNTIKNESVDSVSCAFNESDKDDNNSEMRNENTVWSIIDGESNYNKDKKNNNSPLYYARSNEEELNSGLGIEIKGAKNVSSIYSNKSKVEKHNIKREIAPSPILNEMPENVIPCVSLSYQSQNLFKEKIQQISLENSVENVNSPVINCLKDKSINMKFKDDVELNGNTNLGFSFQLNENSSENHQKKKLDMQIEIKDEYNFHLNDAPDVKEEVDSISHVHYLVHDDNACNNIVLQKTRNTYEKKREISLSTARVAMEPINKHLVNIDLDDDISVNNIAVPLNFENNNSLAITSLELSEIRLSSNIKETKSDASYSEISKSVPVLVQLKNNQIVKVRKYVKDKDLI